MSTGIPYLNEVWNPVTGCSGSGCKAHCWAREMVRRFPAIHGIRMGLGGSRSKSEPLQPERIPFDEVQFHQDRLDQPLHWKKPRRVGVCFMGDLFDQQVREELTWDPVWDIFKVMSQRPEHTFFLLTKQPQEMLRFYQRWIKAEFPNVWAGVSICDQKDADRMIPELLKVPGKKWVSIEPMLGPIDLCKMSPRDNFTGRSWVGPEGIDWVVIGAESGPKRRPCDHLWISSVVNQCRDAGVPVYVKQVEVPRYPGKLGPEWGTKVSHNPVEWPEGLRVQEFPTEKKLPSIKEMSGLVKDMYEGKTLKEYLDVISEE